MTETGGGADLRVEQLLHGVLASTVEDLTVNTSGCKLMLSCVDKAILVSLIAEDWWHSDGAQPTVELLTRQWGVDPSIVRSSLRKLAGAKLLEARRQGNQTAYSIRRSVINERISTMTR